MKKFLIVFCLAILSGPYLFPQEAKDIGAGVIDFLLRNPKTADRMKPAEAVALDIIGDLLKTSSQRKHELNLAEAGSSKFYLNYYDKRHGEIVKDSFGKIYLLLDGIIYPISTELIQQAQSSANISANPIEATNKPINIPEVTDPYNLGKIQIAFNTLNFKDEICTIFTCNNIINREGWADIYKDFQNIKRQFYQNENIQLVVRFNTSTLRDYYCRFLTVKIYDNYDNLKFEQIVKTEPGNNRSFVYWTIDNLKPSIYTIHAILSNNRNEYIPVGIRNKIEQMEILER